MRSRADKTHQSTQLEMVDKGAESQPSVKKNYAYNMAYQVLALLVPFITIPYVSRVLGADGVGTYSFSLSIVTYFMLASALGVQGYGVREIARSRDDFDLCSKLFWGITLTIALTTGACAIAWVGLSFAFPESTLLFLAFTPMLVSVAFDISWFYVGLEKMGHVVLRNTIVKLLGVVLLFALVHSPDDLIVYILINSGVQLAGNLSMWFTLSGLVSSPSFKDANLRRHFRESLVYFVPTLATSLYTVLDKTLIGVITGDSFQNGYYEQADKVVRMAMTLTFTSVNLVLGARLAYLFEKGEVDEARERALRSLDFIMLLGCAFAFGIAGVADTFVPLFFGVGFEPVANLLRFMCPLILIIGVSNCLGSQYYTPSGRRAQSARYIVVGAVCNIALSLALIPFLGMYGAVIGSTAAEVLITVLYIVNCNRFFTWRAIWSRTWPRVVAGVLAIAVALTCDALLAMGSLEMLIVQAIAFGVVYLAVLAIMKDKMLADVLNMFKKRLVK